MVPLIEKALRTSALKLNPRSEGQELVVPVPRCRLSTGHTLSLRMSLPMSMLPRGLIVLLLPTGLATVLLPTRLVMCQLLKPAHSQGVHVQEQ